MKRTKEITIIQYRRRTVKRTRGTSAGECPVCADGSDLITVAAAAGLALVNGSTLDAWIARGQVHSTRSNEGQLYICRGSLLSTVTQEDG